MSKSRHKTEEIFNEEFEVYNSKIRLLSWIYEELKVQPENLKEEITQTGHQLPINI
jgi:hypothetical protein